MAKNSQSDGAQGDTPVAPEEKSDGAQGESAPLARLKPGQVRVRTEHPQRFGHVACYGLTFGPVPKTFAPGELPGDALERLKLDPLLVIEEA